MGVERTWRRPWVCTNGHCRKDAVGTCVYVLTCDHCGKVVSITTRGPADLEQESGWTILDHEECYCKDCK